MSNIEVLRSSVNPWECDVMGHMNVRHYIRCASDGLALLALQLGMPASKLREAGLSLRVADEHVRFHRELRPGAAYRVEAGVVEANPERLRVYQEIRFVDRPEVAATCALDAVLVETATQVRVPWPADTIARARDLVTDVPAHGAPRGIAPEPPRMPFLRDEAIARGLIGAYLGPVSAEDCDAHGFMREAAFMAKISDGITHFFYAVRDRERPSGVGGAALEYRFAFRERPRLGDVVEVRTGLKSVGRKTMQFCHYVFDVESGRCAATSEAVAVSFDLVARKAVEIDEATRTLLQSRVIPGLGV